MKFWDALWKKQQALPTIAEKAADTQNKIGSNVDFAAAEKAADTQNKIGSNVDFAAAEAYKLLRTNLMFTFNGEKKCHLCGITSSFPDEGKSLTSINLALSMAEMGMQILLVECDMRRAVFQEYLEVDANYGLSQVLAGMCTVKQAVYALDGYPGVSVMPGGKTPPNPSELLSSKQMENLLEAFSKSFDLIILDLPPVHAVADAAIASRLTEGLLLVVRDNKIQKEDLAESLRQLSLAKAKVLGFVYNGSDAGDKKHYRKHYYTKNYYQTDEALQTAASNK